MRSVGVFLATAGYTGYFPVAPGTVGSLVGLGIYALMRWFEGGLLQGIVLATVVVLGVWSSTEAERYFKCEDPGKIVIDEVAGMLLTLIWIPATFFGVVAGFILFRFFDIVKPFPIRLVERFPEGWGVMADDLVAGLYSHMVVRLLACAIPALIVV